MGKSIFTTGNMGRNVGRIREIIGMKQETLADAIGLSRQTLSKLEQSTEISEDKLIIIAQALGVTVDDIKNFDEERTINYIQNNYEGSSSNFSGLHHCAINPLDKVHELYEQNKMLYEKLIQAEQEKNELLQKMLSLK